MELPVIKFIIESEHLLLHDEHIVRVNSGDVIIADKHKYLISCPLGSCIAIAFFSPQDNFQAMAHVMLPGRKSGISTLHEFFYAETAMEYIFRKSEKAGVSRNRLEVCLAGGANVLKRKNETIHKLLSDNVLHILSENKIKIRKSSLGGENRRILYYNIPKSSLYLKEGENEKVLFYKYN